MTPPSQGTFFSTTFTIIYNGFPNQVSVLRNSLGSFSYDLTFVPTLVPARTKILLGTCSQTRPFKAVDSDIKYLGGELHVGNPIFSTGARGEGPSKTRGTLKRHSPTLSRSSPPARLGISTPRLRYTCEPRNI